MIESKGNVNDRCQPQYGPYFGLQKVFQNSYYKYIQGSQGKYTHSE